jgi:chemotaxis protein MotB
MSLRREKYDGDVPGSSVDTAERGNTLNSESPLIKHASAKRPTRSYRNLNSSSFQAEENEEGGKDRYLITYSDLITLLLGLFIILYAISKIDATKYDKFISAVGNVFGNEVKIVGMEKKNASDAILPSESLKNKISKVIKDNDYNKSIRLEENTRGIVIHILDDVLFPSGSADLTKSSLDVLSKLAEILRNLPNDIRIEGHTDDIPISTTAFPSNWHLSVVRALNTAYFLVNNEQLPADKISIVGYSKYKPISANDTPEGRANNRRVDIVIIKK